MKKIIGAMITLVGLFLLIMSGTGLLHSHVDSRVAFLIAAGAGALVLVPMGFRLMFAKSGQKQA